MIDLRSDTVTQPSPAMRRAMAEAEVGDDVFGEDPTVRALEERSAELLGTEAGLLVASGTMGNLVGLMAHVPRGGEIIGPAEIHTFAGEAAGYAVVVGASARMLPWADDGTMDLAAIRSAMRDPDDVHEPITSLITIENTHSLSMAQPLTPAYTRSVANLARELGVPLFIDGARHVQCGDRTGCAPAGPRAFRRVRHVLPVEEPGMPRRLGGRRRRRVHFPGPPCAQDGRWRHAPGRRDRGRRPRGAAGRPGRHDRTPRRRPRQRPPTGRRAGLDAGRDPAGSDARPNQLRAVRDRFPVWPDDADRREAPCSGSAPHSWKRSPAAECA